MKVLQIVALLALASQAMAQGWCAAPTLKCMSTGTWTNSLAVEVSLAGNAHPNRLQKFTIEAFTDKGSWCKTTVTPCAGKDSVAFWFGPAPANIAPWTADVQCSAPVPCGTQFVITVKNADGQMSITTCNSPACPAVSAPPPCVASPPPCVASPPPVTVSSPPPCVASPPPYVCSPPPVKVSSPPPCVASPPPCVASPPPVTVYSPPCVSSPPPYCQSPVTVSSPPPKCQSPVMVSSPPPYCQSPVTVSSPPPKCQSPVTVYHKPPPSCGPQCGVTRWGKPVYCKPGKKCCTVTVKKWHGKHCETYTKQECMKKCPKH